MSAFRKVHCIHCEQTYVGGDGDQCSVCLKRGGLINPDDPQALAQLRASKQQEGGDSLLPPMPGLGGMIFGVRILLMAATAFACFCLAIYLLNDALKTGGSLEIKELIPSIGAAVVGLALGGLLVIYVRWKS